MKKIIFYFLLAFILLISIDYALFSNLKNPYCKNDFRAMDEMPLSNQKKMFEKGCYRSWILVNEDEKITNIFDVSNDNEYFVNGKILYYYIYIDEGKTKIYTSINHEKGCLEVDKSTFFNKDQYENMCKEFGNTLQLMPSKTKDVYFVFRGSLFQSYAYNVVSQSKVLLKIDWTRVESQFDFGNRQVIIKMPAECRDPFNFNEKFYQFDENGFDITTIISPILGLKYF